MTTPLITPVMDISWPCILEKECFDMLSSIGYGDFARIFSRFRRYNTVNLGWSILDWVCRLFMMQASRRSVKVHFRFGSIGSSVSTGFKVYLSNCWDPYVSASCTICFLKFFCLISACWTSHYLSKGWVPNLPLLAVSSVYYTKAIGYNFLGVESHFLVLCFFFC